MLFHGVELKLDLVSGIVTVGIRPSLPLWDAMIKAQVKKLVVLYLQKEELLSVAVI